MKKLVITLGILALQILFPISVLAQSYGATSANSMSKEVEGIATIATILVYCCFGIFVLIGLVFKILAIIDIARRESWKNDNDRIIWLLIVIFVPILAIYYLFFYRKTLDQNIETSTTSTPTSM